jgi:starch-binding outer membrane protein, SusD/RagB family
MRKLSRTVAIAAAGTLGACSLDIVNPNQPTRDAVLASPEGVIALATGLQGRFAASYFNYAYMAGVVTDEFSATTAALISISDAEQGLVPPGTGIAENVFSAIYRTVRSADEILDGANNLGPSIEPGTRSGLRALAFALKAEALGEAIQSYQRVPLNTFGVTQPTYNTRAEALTLIRGLLDSAAAQITTTAPSTFFTTQVLTPGVNLQNMIQLFRARYARMANDNATALAAANLVSRTSLSALTYPAPGQNPYNGVTGGGNGIGPRRAWRLSLEAGDTRAAYFVIPSTTVTGRIGTPQDLWNRYGTNPNAPLPVYFPDEALLIKAEAQLALGDAAGARASIDSVRVDCTGGRGLDDPKACLAALSGTLTNAQLLDEIYRQRKAELLGTGLRWEDSRRRSRISGPVAAPAIPVEAQRCWLPYAIGERNANGNVPADPTEPSTFPASCPTT